MWTKKINWIKDAIPSLSVVASMIFSSLCQIWDFYSRGSGRTTYRNFFKTRKKGSCPYFYYARLQLKRIFVKKNTTIRQPFSIQLTIRENTEHLLHMLFVLFQKDQLERISQRLFSSSGLHSLKSTKSSSDLAHLLR